MTLPQKVSLCDALELAALNLQRPLSLTDLSRLLFPGQDWDKPADLGDATPNAKLRDALGLALVRHAACGESYPFDVSDRSIEAENVSAFDPYAFLLLGRTLNFGGPKETGALLRAFREHFEDVVCWAMRRAGFLAEVLSQPRLKRGLPVKLAPALRELVNRFGEAAVLLEDKLVPDDNDLDVDVIAVPTKGHGKRGGWPAILIQCATGAVMNLQSKVDEGAMTFGTVWKNGFFRKSLIRGGATPYELLGLAQVHWDRLSEAGWILDRTRIVHLASVGVETPLPPEVSELWEQLWAVRHDIDWRTGWQETG
jgi:hypothetical protein